MVLNESGSWSAAWDLQAMTSMLGFGVFVCAGDEGDD